MEPHVYDEEEEDVSRREEDKGQSSFSGGSWRYFGPWVCLMYSGTLNYLRCPHSWYSTSLFTHTSLQLTHFKEDNLSTMDKWLTPKGSFVQRFHCILKACARKHVHACIIYCGLLPLRGLVERKWFQRVLYCWLYFVPILDTVRAYLLMLLFSWLYITHFMQ